MHIITPVRHRKAQTAEAISYAWLTQFDVLHLHMPVMYGINPVG